MVRTKVLYCFAAALTLILLCCCAANLAKKFSTAVLLMQGLFGGFSQNVPKGEIVVSLRLACILVKPI